jgi:hypothetical protein
VTSVRGVYAFTEAYIIGSWIVAVSVGDGHLFQRLGAALAALAALFVIAQVKIEQSLEDKMAAMGGEHRTAHVPSAPFQSLRARLLQATRSGNLESVRRSRMKVVVAVTIMACAGELIHGFGDYAVPH